jgi:STIP1 family protein 1
VDPKEPALYTNRALTRIKQGNWDSAISDCNECLFLKPDTMKAFYYLAQAQEQLHDYDTALENAKRAHELCSATGDKSLSAVTALVLEIKKQRWEAREKRRIRDGAELEMETLELIARERDRMLGSVGDNEKRDVEEEWQRKMDLIRNVFERARATDEKERKVPDWAIDDIGFNVMIDPVIVCGGITATRFFPDRHSSNLWQTRRGKSYERSSIMEHLRHHKTDPLTREPLFPRDLIPNLGLKQACDEFLEENGWAVDW